MNNSCLETYRNEIVPYWNIKTRENSDVSAGIIYGKFISFVEDKDFAGASTAKRFLRAGKNLSKHRGNKFKKYYSLSNRSKSYNRLKKEFYYVNSK